LIITRERHQNSGLNVNKFALFSKSGFSRELELENSKNRDLLLYELKIFKLLIAKVVV